MLRHPVSVRQIKANFFYMEPQLDGGTKVCSRGLGLMTKMATTPIYGKKHSKIFFSRIKGPMKHWGLGPIIACLNDDSRLTLTYFTARSIFSLMLLYGENC